MIRKLVLAAALALGLGSTAAHADGFSFSGLFASPSPSAKVQVRQAAHNRYAPYDGFEDVQSGHAYASGYYTSKAKAEGVRSRYTD